MTIQFTRGDTKNLKFRLADVNGNELIIQESDKLFFTIKKNSSDKAFLVQKRIGSGITYSDGYYYITIEGSDTNNFSYGNHIYDLQFKSGNLVKTLILGTLNITEEVTFAENEV